MTPNDLELVDFSTNPSDVRFSNLQLKSFTEPSS